MIIGIDLGNKSRNSISVVDGETLLEWSNIKYDPKTTTTWEHRKKIIKQIRAYIEKYNLTKDDYIIFEKVNMFMRGVNSRLANIMSLAFIQATIINEFSDVISISEVNVMTWKKVVLGNGKAHKEDSVAFIEEHYPQVDLNVIVEHKRKETEYLKDDDTADAICIGLYGNMVNKKKLDEHLVNYT